MDGFALMRWVVALFAIVLITLLFTLNVRQLADAQPVTLDVEILRDVPFGKGGGRTLTMHIIRPKEKPEKPMPVIVWIHGGAWLGGSKDSGIPQLIPFARRGYFGASISYRFSQEAKFPAQIEDCKCAIRFLRAKAEEFHIDSERIGVWGSSAGGHLAAMLGVAGDVKELEGVGGWEDYSSKVNAVCDWFGPSDFISAINEPSVIDRTKPNCPEALLIGGPLLENKEKAMRASPVTYVTPDDPPFLIMHGDKDMVVPFNQSVLLFEALKKAGVEVTLVRLKGAGHGGQGFNLPRVHRLVAAFFDRYLRGESSEWERLVGKGRFNEVEIDTE
ncbi:MAG: alpha/beta hydrolase [Armatimonadota bacterium]|nr:alpha/beta hydrolase [Armatimonadota bacterium]